MRNIDAAPVIITLMIGIVIVSADVRTLLALDAAPPGDLGITEIDGGTGLADEEKMDSPTIEPGPHKLELIHD